MLATRKEYKSLWEDIEKIQEHKVQETSYSEKRLDKIVEKTTSLLNNTSNNERSAPIWSAITKNLQEFERSIKYGGIRDKILKLDLLKNSVHAMWEYGLSNSEEAKWSQEWSEIYPPVKIWNGKEFTYDTYPLMDVNCDKKTQDDSEIKRYMFFQDFFERFHPELEYPFQNYIHDLSNKRSFTARVVQSFQDEAEEALRNKRITQQRYIFIANILMEWVQKSLFVGEGTYDRDDIYNILNRHIDALYSINNPNVNYDREPDEEKEVSLLIREYEKEVGENVR